MECDTNNIFILISALSSFGFTLYCYKRIEPKWTDCTTFYSPNGSEKDYSILKDLFSRILLIGGSVFLILHSIYFGIFDKWLIPSLKYGKTVIILIGAFSYLIYVMQNSINAVNSAIDKKVVVNNFQKPKEADRASSDSRKTE